MRKGKNPTFSFSSRVRVKTHSTSPLPVTGNRLSGRPGPRERLLLRPVRLADHVCGFRHETPVAERAVSFAICAAAAMTTTAVEPPGVVIWTPPFLAMLDCLFQRHWATSVQFWTPVVNNPPIRWRRREIGKSRGVFLVGSGECRPGYPFPTRRTAERKPSEQGSREEREVSRTVPGKSPPVQSAGGGVFGLTNGKGHIDLTDDSWTLGPSPCPAAAQAIVLSRNPKTKYLKGPGLPGLDNTFPTV